MEKTSVKLHDVEKPNEQAKLEKQALSIAATIDSDLAYNSTSMGISQIMGNAAKEAGYGSCGAKAMHNEFIKIGESAQIEATFNFINNKTDRNRNTIVNILKNEKVNSNGLYNDNVYENIARIYNGDKDVATVKKYASELKEKHKKVLEGK